MYLWKRILDTAHVFVPGRFRAAAFDAAYRDRMVVFAGTDRWNAETDRALELLRLNPGKVLLDLGCNTGLALGRARALYGCGIAGVDVNVDAIATGSAEMPGVPLRHYDGGRIPFADCNFDAVLLVHVLDHVKDPRATLAEVARVLRPGGVVAVITPNRGYKLAMVPRNVVGSYLPDMTILRYYSAQSLRRQLGRVGFDVEIERFGGNSWPWLPFPSWRFRLIALAKKPTGLR